MSAVALALVGLYLLVTLGIGWYGYRHTGTTPREYVLAGGTLGRVVFPLSLFATLMSAFIFLGSAGWGYTHGMAWLAMIGVEAVAGIPLALVGLRAWRLANREDYLTPPGLLGGIFDSDAVKLAAVAVQFAWAIPYVAIQAMGGGLLFDTISGGAITFPAGALLVTVVTAVYLSLGGLRGAAWSDVLQGVTVVVMLVAALVWVVPQVDPLALTRTIATETDLLTTTGAVGLFTPRVWLSFLLMNSMAMIAYPQMFQRFFAAEDERAFRSLLRWWPVMALVAAVVPVLLGVWGSQVLPGLDNPDVVIPRLLQEFAPRVVVGVVVGGAVAATMSTADSLVLTLSSIVSRDVYRDHLQGRTGEEVAERPADGSGDAREVWVTRATTVVLLAGGYVLALVATGRVPGIAAVGTIIDLAVYFIQGNALLLPAFLAALYWPRATAAGALASVVGGQAYFLAGAFGPAPAFGFTPFVPALFVALALLAAGSVLSAPALSTPRGEI